ncbi:hypothetical protein BGW80DRAFT_1330412, partial [Lactifluus volemus]
QRGDALLYQTPQILDRRARTASRTGLVPKGGRKWPIIGSACMLWVSHPRKAGVAVEMQQVRARVRER